MEKHLRIMKLSVLLIAMVLINQSIEAQTPPNGVEISEGIFIDQTEVSNLDWQEFMYWHKKHYGEDSPEYKATICDSTVWDIKSTEAKKNKYFQHPAYKSYPIVGITYEQAILYCNWRSERVNEFYYIKENKKVDYETLINSDIEVPQIYKYRLPTKEEWESVAKIGDSKKVKKQIEKKQITRYNYALTDKTIETSKITAPVFAYYPNELGIYNIFGNVAEMLSEKGVAKGGSWFHEKPEELIETNFEYTEATKWLGFRCICEKVE